MSDRPMDLYGEVAAATGERRQKVKSLCWPLMYRSGPAPTKEELIAYVNALKPRTGEPK